MYEVKKSKMVKFSLGCFYVFAWFLWRPEAHYGVFSSILVEKRKYLTEEELTEMIGLYALVPGQAVQTITAIGYYIGGPILALFLSLFGHYQR